MKKLILTVVLAMGTLIVSAQMMVVTSINKTADGEEAGMENITDRMGIGYLFMNNYVVGLQSSAGDDGYDIFFRYLWQENIYVSLNMPTEEATDNMEIGIGFSLNVWEGLYVEPNYNIPLSEDDNGDREGDFNLGLSYRF